MKIIISAFSRHTTAGLPSPKNYPYWPGLLDLLRDHEILQVKTKEEPALIPNFIDSPTFSDLNKLLFDYDSWISVDNFFQHFAHYYGKFGNVIWGQSDPILFGYKENNNIYKDKSFFRKNQFWLWSQTANDDSAFLQPEEVLKKLKFKP